MSLTEMFTDFLQSWLGGGAIVGIFSAVLIYKSSKKGRDIDWYDRAINQVKDLDKEVSDLKERINSLNVSLVAEQKEKHELQDVVKKLEYIISVLKAQIETEKKVLKKESEGTYE